MEIEKLRSMWNNYDKKLEKSLTLNTESLSKVNFDKAANEIGWLLFLKIVELIILLPIFIGLSVFTFAHWTEMRFSLPSCTLDAFVISGLVSVMHQIILIAEIRKGGAMPVTSLQKRAEKLKILIIKYTRTSFVTVPFYPLLLIVSARMFFNVDLWQPQYYKFLQLNFLLGLVLILVFLWIFNKLRRNSTDNSAALKYLSGAGWNQAVLAQKFLDELDNFKN